MKNLNFRTKILILVVTPLIIISILLTLLSINQANKLGEKNISTFSDTIFNLRREELKNYTELATSTVEHVRKNQNLTLYESQELAKDIYRDMSFGEDGYFFVYDYNGINLAHPKKPQLEGKNLWGIQDSGGVLLIQSLIDNAKRGGGYTDYVWDKPSKGREVGKIGYSVGYDDWQWMIGTGLYVDDLEDAIQAVDSEISGNIQSTLQLTAIFAAIFTLIVGFISARFTLFQGKLADSRLQELSRKAVVSQEEERRRIALDLQKNINQALVSTKTKLTNVKRMASNESIIPKDFLAALESLNNTIHEVNRISGDLLPESLDKKGTFAAVQDLCIKSTKESRIQFIFKAVEGKQTLAEEVGIAVYRIVQEGIKNIILHSGASEANIRLRQTSNSLNINIQDNGMGFETKGNNSSEVGFDDMRIRAESLGGHFSVFSSKDIGTVVKVVIPL